MDKPRSRRCVVRARPRIALLALAVPCGLAARSTLAHAEGPVADDATSTTVTIPGGPVVIVYAPRAGSIETSTDDGSVHITWTSGDDGSSDESTTTVTTNESTCTCAMPDLGFAVPSATTSDPIVDTSASDPSFAPPQAGAVVFGMRFPWDVEALPNGVGIGVGGMGLDLGVRVADALYLGGSADWEAVIDPSGFEAGPGYYNRIRMGGELRYYFRTSTPGYSGDEGAAAIQTWVGLRAGVERFQGDLTSGRFADLTLGDDFWFGPLGMNIYLSAGLSNESASAFGNPDSTQTPSSTPDVLSGSSSGATAQPASATTMSPYLTLGMSILFS